MWVVDRAAYENWLATNLDYATGLSSGYRGLSFSTSEISYGADAPLKIRFYENSIPSFGRLFVCGCEGHCANH